MLANKGSAMQQRWSETILNSIFDIIVVVDHKYIIVDANSAIETIGYTIEDLQGKSLFDFTPDDNELKVMLTDVITDNGLDRVTKRINVYKKDGTTFVSDTVISNIKNNGDDIPTNVLCVFHDVTERAIARKALEEQKKIIEASLQEADRLRQEAVEAKKQLQEANAKLTGDLLKETEFRMNSMKTSFQKTFSTYLIALVALALLLPYISGIMTIETKILDNTSNLSLLLLQTLGIIAGYLFSTSRNKDTDKGE